MPDCPDSSQNQTRCQAVKFCPERVQSVTAPAQFFRHGTKEQIKTADGKIKSAVFLKKSIG